MIAPGFRAQGVACGIKPGGKDLAIVATADGRSVPAAAVFTTNAAAAAPVQVSRAHLEASGGAACAVVVNSGNANAATGAQGMADAARTCDLAAAHLGCDPEYVLVCSTGLIGIPLDMAAVERGIPRLWDDTPGGPAAAAEAILTTDSGPKVALVDGGGFTVAGMAKGVGMLAPHMATMLALVTTDAALDRRGLDAALRAAVGVSFNALSVDGCTSTNDTTVVLASGLAGPPGAGAFADALAEVCTDLAMQMARDAEGATRVARVHVVGARNDDEAAIAARRVSESQLVKCSLHGADPYWGRIVSEIGAAGVTFAPDRVSVSYGDVVVCRGGVAVPHDAERARAQLIGAEVSIIADLGLGSGRATMITTDLGPGYIAENMRTS